ncbi:MAG: hypothetical protein AAF333_12435 [Planctomycetota bacterium]
MISHHIIRGCITIAVILLVLVFKDAAAQSFNVDVGGAYLGEAPDETFAAGGQAGYWNLLGSSDDPSETALRDLTGQLTAVTAISVRSTADLQGDLGRLFRGRADSEARLLGDYLVFLRELQFLGLDPGHYRVTVYAAGHAGEPYPGTVEARGVTTEAITLAGVYRTSTGLVDGSTHASAIVAVDDSGLLRILTDRANDHFLNGVQIELVPEPGMLGLVVVVGASFLCWRGRRVF